MGPYGAIVLPCLFPCGAPVVPLWQPPPMAACAACRQDPSKQRSPLTPRALVLLLRMWPKQKSTKIPEIVIPNNTRILDFTIYLQDLVYWVGFVTGVPFTTHL